MKENKYYVEPLGDHSNEWICKHLNIDNSELQRSVEVWYGNRQTTADLVPINHRDLKTLKNSSHSFNVFEQRGDKKQFIEKYN